MAKIFLRGRQPIALSNEKAKQLKDEWLANILPDVVDTDFGTFKSRDISGFGEIFGEDKTERRYDLNDPKQKELIRQFEIEFKNYMAQHPDYNWENRMYISLLWFQELGAIKLKGDTSKKPTIDNLWNYRYSIVDPILFKELSKKWSALNELKWRRTTAKRAEREAMESMGL